MTGVRPATPADAAALRAVLRRAFDGDPVVNWVVRQDGGREWGMRWLFRLTLDIGMSAGHVYTAADGRGVAIWSPPGEPAAGQVRHIWRLPGFVRAVGIARLPRVVRAVAALSARHPRPVHWYLSELAVDPPAQGRGIGGALLADRLAECDRAGQPAYLENSNPRNTPLYERHGFEVLAEHRIGGDGPPIWLMWRDPLA